MTIAFPNRARGNGGMRAFDADVLAWRDAVVANGGSVSLAQLVAVDQLFFSLKAAGAWALYDDALLLVAENAQQAYTSLKQRRLATSVNSPLFAAAAGVTFDGATNYLNTNLIPSLHCPAAAADSIRLEIYERVDVSGASYAAGAASATGSRSIRINPRSGGTTLSAAANTNQAGASFTLPVADSRGMSAVQRSAASAAASAGYKSGLPLVRTLDPTTFGTTLPSDALYLGAVNQVGTPAFFRATTLGWAAIGAAMSDAVALAAYNAVQAYMITMGANV